MPLFLSHTQVRASGFIYLALHTQTNSHNAKVGDSARGKRIRLNSFCYSCVNRQERYISEMQKLDSVARHFQIENFSSIGGL